MLYITNGYSDAMQRDPSVKILNYPLSEEQFINIVHNTDFVSIIGHENIAQYLTQLTGRTIQKNRQGITLNYGDEVICISLLGRLPEQVRHVEFKGRVNFTYKRFERQSLSELLESETRINQMIEIEEE